MLTCLFACLSGASIVRQNSSWDGRKASETPALHLLGSCVWPFGFRNWRTNIHTHFTPWLASCAEVREEPRFELLSVSHKDFPCFGGHNFYPRKLKFGINVKCGSMPWSQLLLIHTFILDKYFCHFFHFRKLLSATLWIPFRRDCLKNPPLITMFSSDQLLYSSNC